MRDPRIEDPIQRRKSHSVVPALTAPMIHAPMLQVLSHHGPLLAIDLIPG